MSKPTKPIGSLLQESGVDPNDLPIDDRLKFTSWCNDRRNIPAYQGKKFKSFQEAYDRIVVPVFREKGRIPPSLDAARKMRLLQEGWIAKDTSAPTHQQAKTRLEKPSTVPPSEDIEPSEEPQTEDAPPELSDEDWERVDEIGGDPFFVGRFFAPVVTPKGLRRMWEARLSKIQTYVYLYLGLQVNHRSGKSDWDFTIEGISDVLELDTRQVRDALKKLQDVKLITISLEGKAEFPRSVQCFRVYLPAVMEARQDEVASNRLKRKTANKERGESGYSAYHLYKIFRENPDADSEAPSDN